MVRSEEPRANPNISGSANISGGSLGREGIYTTLTGLGGDIRFNENRVTFDNVEGRVGLGVVRLRGTGLIRNSRMEGLNVRIDTDQVRLRYPEGLRSSVTGGLVLRGTSDEPTLDGNLQLDSITYRSSFEPSSLSWLRPGGLNSGGSALDRLRLSVHVAGNRTSMSRTNSRKLHLAESIWISRGRGPVRRSQAMSKPAKGRSHSMASDTRSPAETLILSTPSGLIPSSISRLKQTFEITALSSPSPAQATAFASSSDRILLCRNWNLSAWLPAARRERNWTVALPEPPLQEPRASPQANNSFREARHPFLQTSFDQE